MSLVLPSSAPVVALTDPPVDPDEGKEKTKFFSVKKVCAVNSQGNGCI